MQKVILCRVPDACFVGVGVLDDPKRRDVVPVPILPAPGRPGGRPLQLFHHSLPRFVLPILSRGHAVVFLEQTVEGTASTVAAGLGDIRNAVLGGVQQIGGLFHPQ